MPLSIFHLRWIYKTVIAHIILKSVNPGESAILWGNPKCTSIKTSDDGAIVGSVSDDAACAAADPDYFDLNRPADEVNAELNSQDVKALPVSYDRLDLALLGGQQGGANTYDNVTWAHADVEERAFPALLTEWSAAIDPPLKLGEGERVTLTLNYSLSGLVETGLTNAEVKVPGEGMNQGDKYDDCNDDFTICINAPALSVTFSK